LGLAGLRLCTGSTGARLLRLTRCPIARTARLRADLLARFTRLVAFGLAGLRLCPGRSGARLRSAVARSARLRADLLARFARLVGTGLCRLRLDGACCGNQCCRSYGSQKFLLRKFHCFLRNAFRPAALSERMLANMVPS